MKSDWPPLSDFEATSGRLATEDDTRANRAVFLLQSSGVRVGTPMNLSLPCYAWLTEKDSGERKRCIIIQAEVLDGKEYFGAWLVDDKKQAIGTSAEFEVIRNEK
jgi:hypothetical protein